MKLSVNKRGLAIATALGAVITAIGFRATRDETHGRRETGVCRFSTPDGGVEVVNLADASPRSCMRAAIERSAKASP